MPRLFIAIDLPEEHKNKLGQLKENIPTAKWVKTEKLHLTIKFIGEVDDALLERIKVNLAEVDYPAFTLSVAGVGCFQQKGKAKVLWAGVEPHEDLIKLHCKLETKLTSLGIKAEPKKFSPHMTLSRLKNLLISDTKHFLEKNQNFQTELFTVDTFHLYSSELTSQGAIHKKEGSFKLQKNALWHVYILECNDKTFYTGITTNLKRRLEEHNQSSSGAKYTRSRRPVKLVYSCDKQTKSEAQKEEYRIKQLPRIEKAKIINNWTNKSMAANQQVTC